MNLNWLHKYPSLRLIIPWIAGVSGGNLLFDGELEFRVMYALALLSGVLLIILYPLKRYVWRWCFGVALFFSCFCGGWLSISIYLQRTVYSYPDAETVYLVRLENDAEEKARSWLCRAVVEEWRDSLTVYPVQKKVLLYFSKDSLSVSLKGGDILLVSSRISSPRNALNFDEFDYASFLRRQGISGTGYVAQGKWEKIASFPERTMRRQADIYRGRLLQLYEELGFSGDGLAVLSALTVGDKTELSESIRESYSVAGASHVLALSGLHIGLLYWLLNLCLKRITGRMGALGIVLRLFLIVGVLVSFAFFTGLSSSVVRSVSMYSMLAVAQVFSRQSLSFNTLLIVAWGMLLFSPVWLFDVGFQLSFSAVAAILLIQSSLSGMFVFRHRSGKWLVDLLSVSIAAQLGTAPLVIFYFSHFSTHFLLTNLVVIPLVSFILYLAVLMLCLTPLPFLQVFVACLCRFLLEILNAFVRWVEHLPLASIDNIWLYAWEVVACYLFMIGVGYLIRHPRARNLFMLLLFVLMISIAHSVHTWVHRPQCSIVFYNSKTCPAVHCIASDGRSWIHFRDRSTDSRDIYRIAENYWRKMKLPVPAEVKGDMEHTSFFRKNQILNYKGCSIAMVTDNRWNDKKSEVPLPVNYLYVCKGYQGTLQELVSLFVPQCVVLDASLTPYWKNHLIEECNRLSFEYVSLSEKGSVRFLL